MTALPSPPLRRFASDNNAGAHPAVLQALTDANSGHELAYGDDPWTQECAARLRDLFGVPTETFLVWGGTGANVLSLATMLGPAGAVVCTESAHINVDETGAPERILGAKLMDLPTPDGKLVPEQLESLAHFIGDQHHAQPSVVSITQSTEVGTLYSADEVAALCDTAHRLGMTVHMDGARIANATAALGGTVAALRSFTVDAGVDVVSFGGTKNGMVYGEAVVYLNPALARSAAFVRKQVTQLPSKMRFIAAQLTALLADDLWIDNARHANAMSQRLYSAVRDLPGLTIAAAPVVNSLYPCIAPQQRQALQEWSFFYDWDVHLDQVRWMTAWDTTEEDVDRFAAGVTHVLAPAN